MAARSAACVIGLALALAACSSATVPVEERSTQAPPPEEAPAPVVPKVEPKAQPVKAALLLPLSGPRAELGQQLLNAAQMAVFDVSGSDFELLPRDTKGTPQGAASAARQALADGARIILGPLFAPEVTAVKPIAQSAGVDVVAFSTDLNVAGAGAHVIGFAPADQVSRVASFAGSRGLRRFAVVAPRGDYGEAVVGGIQAVAGKMGAQITAVARYDSTVPDFGAALQEIAHGQAAPQAILFGDSVDRAKQFAAAATTAGIDLKQVRLLGTGMWDVPTIARETALVGAWYAAPDPARRADFEAKFEQLYGKKPQRITTLAYDATALAATLARMEGAAGVTHSELVGENGFEGLDGLFRLRANGVAERKLAVIEITANGLQVVDPAPTSFDSVGY